MKRRGSGILIHLTSLPSPFGIGDMGPGSFRFIDFLVQAKQSYWQILPLNPTDLVHGNSPYHSSSAFALNPLLISPELLAQDGLLEDGDFSSLPDFPEGRIDYRAVSAFKKKLFDRAYERFQRRKGSYEYERFCRENAYWLDDFVLFRALKFRFQGRVWNEWPQEIKERNPKVLESLESELNEVMEKEKFLQYLFFKQWNALRNYCHKKGIQIIGDLPIYVTYDSVDLWTHTELFKLDQNKRPRAVAGVPPDYFSATGQLWGNPVYQWEALKETGYRWWIQRIRHNLSLFDFIRIDHFRGFIAYWEVPAGEKNAKKGRWVKAPAMDFFHQLNKSFSCLPIIAEDLGVITPEVREVMNYFGFPGMKLLLFAFGEDLPTNPYILHNLERNCIAYTGTHDNNTVQGWYKNEAKKKEKERLFQYLGRKVPTEELHWEMIRLLMMSVANTVIFPMQDILGLGKEARMNRPATLKGNWQWRLLPDQLTSSLAERLRQMTEIYGRG